MPRTENDFGRASRITSQISFTGLEDLFYKYGVDLEFSAHEHSYERLWPIYDRQVYNGSDSDPYNNPKAPVHIITGMNFKQRRRPF